VYYENATLVFVPNVDGAQDDRATIEQQLTVKHAGLVVFILRNNSSVTELWWQGENSVHGGITINRINWGLQLSLSHSFTPSSSVSSTLLFSTPLYENMVGDGRVQSCANFACRKTRQPANQWPRAAGLGDWPWISHDETHMVTTGHWLTIYYHPVNTLCLRHLHIISVMRARRPDGW